MIIMKRHHKRYKRKSAVSDILGNILILAITVTLFSTLFYWVSTIPSPPPSIKADFYTQLGLKQLNNGNVELTYIHIIDIGGNALYNSGTIIYISYENTPQYNNHYTITDGGITSGTWTPGETWVLTLPTPITNPGSVTTSIIDTSKNVLVWSNQDPATDVNLPPQILSIGTSPGGAIAINSQFYVWAKVINPNTNSGTLTVSVTLPVLSSTPYTMTYSTTLQEYISSAINAPSTPETISGFVNATTTIGLSTTAVISINFIQPFYGQPDLVFGGQSEGWYWIYYIGLPYSIDYSFSQPIGVTISIGSILSSSTTVITTLTVNGEVVNTGSAPAQDVAVWINGTATNDHYHPPTTGTVNYNDSSANVAPTGRTTFTFSVDVYTVETSKNAYSGTVAISIYITYWGYNTAGNFVEYPPLTGSVTLTATPV
ncbi:MAG: hypothetical protein M1481_01845 [Candidatus Thermoplasmatota archaeon]|nr:hypothetical protein [Candidatus Thermoplasmatota archaeon]MCL5962904.1 hypothetical protein [Candidatus Thermoplasmatota archaeon]